MGQKIYRTMQGREIELDKFIMRNETVVAVGNANVNARGDELGPGGQIIRRREEIVSAPSPDRADYTPHQTRSKPEAIQEAPVEVKTEVVAEKVAPQVKPTVKKTEEKAE